MTVATGSSDYTRVAVVQLDYHPAALINRRSPLEDPLFDWQTDTLLPADGVVPPAFEQRWKRLRTEIRNAYSAQLLRRVSLIIARLRQWNVKVAVFPEYSIPWEILGGVSDAAGDMLVVAGTHAVDRQASESDLYARLGHHDKPIANTAVCPVLQNGSLLSLGPKLNAATPERQSLALGNLWAPVETMGLAGPLGVMICLDFLHRESPSHHELVSEALARCRLLAVPSLTPHYTQGEFAAKAWEEARRYGRPVLYSDAASGGGSSIFADEGTHQDLRRFPETTGVLDRFDEGVVVADLDLGSQSVGRSTRYASSQVVRSYAAASLVYRARRLLGQYADFLAGLEDVWTDPEAIQRVSQAIGERRELLDLVAAVPHGDARYRRLRRLLTEYESESQITEMHKFLREVVLPLDVLPLPLIRSALARGAADVVFGWLREERTSALVEVESKLREGAEREAVDKSLWQPESLAVMHQLAESLREPEQISEQQVIEPPVRVVLPDDFHPANLGHIRAKDDHEVSYSFSMSVQRTPGWQLVVGSGIASRLLLLARARGLRKLAVGVRQGDDARMSTTFLLFGADDGWRVWCCEDGAVFLRRIQSELSHVLTGSITVETWTDSDFRAVARDEFLPWFDKAAIVARELLRKRLELLDGEFVEPHVLVANATEPTPGLRALDDWLASKEQTALVLGGFGTGKSTLLAQWSTQRWQAEPRPGAPLPLLVNLAGIGDSLNPIAMLLKAANVANEPKAEAAVKLLIELQLLLPVFDGFDEMATRLTSSDLAGKLSQLMSAAGDGGRVVISSRDNYFPSERVLHSATGQALQQALGSSAGLRRLAVQLFDAEQVERLAHKVLDNEATAQAALRKIADLYPLQELVARPLFLGIILQTIDQIEPGAVTQAGLYEQYLTHWLAQTHEGEDDAFTDEQKQIFAEAMADHLWRSGQPSCRPEDIKRSVRAVLASNLPDDVTLDSAYLEAWGGTFFAREGEDQFRFAHKSFLEFFLARALIKTAAARPAEVLATMPLTQEVALFVYELLHREGEPREAPFVRQLQTWLSQAEDPRDEDYARKTAPAAANAIRLFCWLSRLSNQREGWLPERADLRYVLMPGEDLAGIELREADFSFADLSGTDLSAADLSMLRCHSTKLAGASLARVQLNGSRFEAADLTAVLGDGASLIGVEMQHSNLSLSSWIESNAEQLTLREVDLTGAVWFGATGWSETGRKSLDVAGNLASLSPAVAATIRRGHHGSVNSVSFSPDGARLASGGYDGTVRVWESSSGRELAKLEGHSNGVNSVSFSPDGARLASGGDDGTVRLWESSSGRELAKLEGHSNGVISVSFSPDGARLASGGLDGTARLWESSSGRELAKLEGHEHWVNSVSFSPDGARLASGGYDGTVRVWESSSGRELAKLEGHSNGVNSVSFSPDGARLASGGDDGTVRVWESSSGRELVKLEGHSNGVNSVSFSPDGARLASGGLDGTVRVWESSSGREILRLAGQNDFVLSVSFSADGARLASGGDDGTVRVWESSSGRELARLEGFMLPVNSVSFSPDGARLASGGDDGTVRVWESSSGREILRLEGQNDFDLSVSFSPDGARLASGGDDGTVWVSESSTGRELARIKGHWNKVNSVSFSPDGARLASGGSDGTVRLWESSSGRELAKLEGHSNGVNSVSFSPDGARLASGGSDGTVRLWESSSGRELAKLEGDSNGVYSVSFSPDGARLASGGSDGTVRVWESSSGRELAKLEGHSNGVRSVSFSPDGARLASGGSDGTVRVWESSSGRELAKLEGHSSWVRSVSFSPDGARLASGGDDGTVRVWESSSGRELARIEIGRKTSVVRACTGYFDFSGPDTQLALSLVRPANLTCFYRPLGALRALLHRPDKVAAALRGEINENDLPSELTARGWHLGPDWDGERHVVTIEPNEPLQTAVLVAVAPPLVEATRFRPGPAITDQDSLCGRESLLQELTDLLSSRSPARLCGPRRSGKTSMLYTLARRLESDDWRVVHRSLEGTEVRTIDDLACHLDGSLSDKLRAGERFRKQLAESPRTVLLLDEIAHLGQANHQVFAWLRRIGQESTSILYAGTEWDWATIFRRAAEAPGSSFGNDVTLVTLGPIDREASSQFLVETAAGYDVRLEDTAKWIIERVGCWPFYLQVMGHAVVQAVRAGNRRALVDGQGVDDLYEQRLLSERDAVFAGRWKELPKMARELLLFDAEGIPPSLTRLSSTHRELLNDVGLTRPLAGWIEDKPFFDWLRRHRELLQNDEDI